MSTENVMNDQPGGNQPWNRIFKNEEVAELPTTGSNPESPIQQSSLKDKIRLRLF